MYDTLGIELRKHNINVSTIFPDSVKTPMLTYEASHGGSPLTFFGKALSPEKIVQAVIKAIERNRSEIYVPMSSGIFSKIIMCWPLLESIGEKNKKIYQAKS